MFCGATVGGRTRDLILTMDALYQLSYRGQLAYPADFRIDGVEAFVCRPLVSPRWCSAELKRTLNLKTAWWVGKDSNLRRRKPRDLQSLLVDRLSTNPYFPY